MAYEQFVRQTDPEEESDIPAGETFDETPEPLQYKPKTGAASAGISEPTSTEAAESFTQPEEDQFIPFEERPLTPRPKTKVPKLLSFEETQKAADDLGDRTIGDSFKDFLKIENIPFIGPIIDAYNSSREETIRRKLAANAYTNDEERRRDEKWFVDRKNEQRVQQLRASSEWHGLPYVQATDMALQNASYIAEFIASAKWGYKPTKQAAARALFRDGSKELARASKAARWILKKQGMTGKEANYATLLSHKEGQLLTKIAGKQLGSKLLTNFAGLMAQQPYFWPRVMQSVMAKTAPVVEEDEYGRPRLVTSQKEFLRTFAVEQAKMIGETMSERLGPYLMKPVAGAVKPILAPANRAMQRLLPRILSESTEAAALNAPTVGLATRAAASPLFKKNLQRTNRVLNIALGRMFKEGIAPTDAFGNPVEELLEEWANDVYISAFNLNRDENLNPDGSEKPWSTRLSESLLMPATRPKETLAMMMSFAAIGSVGGIAHIASDPVAAKQAEHNARVFRRLLNGEIIRSNEEVNSVVDAVEEIAKNEDYQRWYAGIFPKAKPRPGSLESMLQETYDKDRLTEIYRRAERETPGSGRAILEDRIRKSQLGLILGERDYKEISNFAEKGLVGATIDDYRSAKNIRILSDKHQALVSDISNGRWVGKELEDKRQEASDLEAQIDQLQTFKEVNLAMEKSRLIRGGKGIRKLVGAPELFKEALNPESAIAKYVVSAEETPTDSPAPMITLDLNIATDQAALDNFIQYLGQGDTVAQTNLRQVVAGMKRLGADARRIKILPSYIAPPSIGHMKIGKVAQLRGSASPRMIDGQWEIALTLDATARDAVEELIESRMHEINQAGNYEAQAKETRDFLVAQTKDAIQKAEGDDLSFLKRYYADNIDPTQTEAKSVAQMREAWFEEMSSLGALSLGARLEEMDVGRAIAEGETQRFFDLLSQYDPTFIRALRFRYQQMLGENFFNALKMAPVSVVTDIPTAEERTPKMVEQKEAAIVEKAAPKAEEVPPPAEEPPTAPPAPMTPEPAPVTPLPESGGGLPGTESASDDLSESTLDDEKLNSDINSEEDGKDQDEKDQDAMTFKQDYGREFRRRLVEMLGLKFSDTATRDIDHMVRSSLPNLREAVKSEEAYQKYLKTKSENPAEVRLLKLLNSKKISRGNANGLYVFVTSTHTPAVQTVKFDAFKKQITAIEPVYPDVITSWVHELNAKILDATNDDTAIKRITNEYAAYVKNPEISSTRMIRAVIGDHILNPEWMAELEDQGSQVTPKGMTAEEYALARYRYSRFLQYKNYSGMIAKQIDAQRDLLSNRFMTPELEGHYLVDAIARSLSEKISTLQINLNTGKITKEQAKILGGKEGDSISKEAAKAYFRRRTLSDTFISFAQEGALGAKLEEKAREQYQSESQTPMSNLARWIRMNRWRENFNPYWFRSPTGKRENNLLFIDQLTRSLMESEDYNDLMYVNGVWSNQQASEYDAKEKVTYRYRKSVDAKDLSAEDQAMIEQALFDKGEDTFYMWAGQMGDQKRLPFVRVTKIKRGDAEWEKKYVEEYNRLGADIAKEFLPTIEQVRAEKSDYKYNYYLHFPHLMKVIHGDLRQYPSQADLIKRASGIVAQGFAPNTDILGEKFNSIVINDLKVKDELGELRETTDGFAYMVNRWADRYQESLGDWITNKGTYEKLTTAKSLQSSVDPKTGRRQFSKFNFITLTPELAKENPNTAHAVLYKLIEDYNRTAPEGKQIDVVYFASAAKKHDKAKAVDLFKENSLEINEGALTPDKVFENNSKDLVYILDARHDTSPKLKKIPVQKKSDLVEMETVLFEQTVQYDRLSEKLKELEGKAVDYKKELRADGMHWLIPIIEKQEVPDARNEDTVLAALSYAVNKIVQDTGNIVHAIEVPIAAMPNQLPTMTAMRRAADGTYRRMGYQEFLDNPSQASKVKLSRVNINLSRKGNYRYTQSADNPWLSAQDAVARIKANPEKYLDMFEFDDQLWDRMKQEIRWDNKGKWNVQTWELDYDPKTGKYRIPGELVMYSRVPGDNAHSHTLARLNGRVSADNSNFIQTALEDQVNAGSDFDVDSRFIETLFKGKDGNTEGGTDTRGRLNTVMLRWALDYGDPKNLKSLKAGINKDMGKATVDYWQAEEGKDKQPLANPDQARKIRVDNKVGKLGVGIAASENAAYSLMNKHGVLLDLRHFEAMSKKEWDKVKNMPKNDESWLPEYRISLPGSKNKERALVLNLATDDAFKKRQAGYPAFKEYLGNILNMFLDNTKEDIVRHFGVNEVTANIATTLMFANADLQNAQDVNGYLDVVADYLHSDLVKNYVDLVRSRSNVGTLQNRAGIWEDLKAMDGNYDEIDVHNLSVLTQMAQDLRNLGTLLRSTGEAPTKAAELDKFLLQIDQTKGNAIPHLEVRKLQSLWTRKERPSPFLLAVEKNAKHLRENVFNKALWFSKTADQIRGKVLITEYTDAQTLNRADRQMRLIATMNAVHQLKSPAHRQQRFQGPGGEIRKTLANRIRLARNANPDNMFLASVDVFNNQVSLLDIFRLADLSPEIITDIQTGWDELYTSKENKALAIDILQASLALHGLTYNKTQGSLLQFIGPKMSKALNEALVTEMELWRTSLLDNRSLERVRRVVLAVDPRKSMPYDPATDITAGRIPVAKEAPAEPETVQPVAPAAEGTRTVTRQKWITRAEVLANPNTIYLFGDNLKRVGMGGQAKEMRGAPNAIGIVTKKAPSMAESAFLTDAEYEANAKQLDADFAKIPADKNVVVPEMGVGLAQLPTRAPRTFAYLQQKIAELEGKTKPVPAAGETINIYAGTGENADLSNFAERPFTVDGKKFHSVEQFYQFSKVMNAFDSATPESADLVTGLANKILKTTDGGTLRKMGRATMPDAGITFNEKLWSRVAESFMREGIYESFKQNPGAKARLLATGNATLTHKQDTGKWKEAFPRLLMEVREELRTEAPAAEGIKQAEQKVVKELETKSDLDLANELLDSLAADAPIIEEPSMVEVDVGSKNMQNDPDAAAVAMMLGELGAQARTKQGLEEKKDPATLEDLREAHKNWLREVSKQDEVPKNPNNTQIATPEGQIILLNNDQEDALRALQTWWDSGKSSLYALEGKGGSGKTTIIHEFLIKLQKEQNKRVVVSATLHDAKDILRLRTQADFPTTTIQSLLGERPDETNPSSLFNGNFSPAAAVDEMKGFEGVDVVLVDEAQRLTRAEMDAIKAASKQFGTKFIFLGDRKQSGAIETEVQYLGETPAAFKEAGEARTFLARVERAAADNPLLLVLDKIREGEDTLQDQFQHINMLNAKGEGVLYTDDPKSYDRARAKVYSSETYKKDPTTAITISLTNGEVVQDNNFIRETLFPGSAGKDMVVGEHLRVRRTIMRQKARYVTNGEVFVVTKVGPPRMDPATGIAFYGIELERTDRKPTKDKDGKLSFTERKITKDLKMLVESDAANVKKFKDTFAAHVTEAYAARSRAVTKKEMVAANKLLDTYLTKKPITVNYLYKGKESTKELVPSLPNAYATNADMVTGSTYANVFFKDTRFSEGLPAKVMKGDPARGIEGVLTLRAKGKTAEADELYRKNVIAQRRKKYTAMSRASKRAIMLTNHVGVPSKSGIDLDSFIKNNTFSAVEWHRMDTEAKEFAINAYSSELTEIRELMKKPALSDEEERRKQELIDRVNGGTTAYRYKDYKASPLVQLEDGTDEEDPDMNPGFWKDLTYFFSDPRRVPSLAFETAQVNTGKVKPTSEEIKGAQGEVADLVAMLKAPDFYIQEKREFIENFAAVRPGIRKAKEFKEFERFFSRQAYVERMMETYHPDTGIDSKVLRQLDQELEDEGLTHSAVEWNNFRDGMARSFIPERAMQNMLIESTREVDAALKLAARRARKWGKDLKELSKLTNISELILDSAFGVQQEGMGGYIFNDAEAEKDARGLPKVDKDGNVAHTPIWFDPITGKRASEIPELAAFLHDKYRDVIDASKVLAAVEKASPEIHKKLKKEFLGATEAQRLNANERIQGFADRLEGEVWIQKFPNYILHQYLKKPRELRKPNRADLLKATTLLILQEKFPSIKTLNKLSPEAEAYLNEPRVKAAIEDRTTARYQMFQKQYDDALSALMSTVKRRKEDSGRADRRAFDTYADAVEKAGFIPVTLRMTGLYKQWESSVSHVIRNKKYLTYASMVTDINGHMSMIPVKREEHRKQDKDTSIGKRQAEGILKTLINFANQSPINKLYKRKAGVDVWTQIEQITDDISEQLMDLGYEMIEMPEYNLSHVWVKRGAPKSLLKHITSRGFEDLKGSKWYPVLVGVRVFNNFTKSLALGLSAFHHFALAESYAAGYGVNAGNPLLTPFHVVKHIGMLKKVHDRLRDDPEFAAKWAKAGLQYDVDAPDYDIGAIDKWLTEMADAGGKTSLTRLHLRRRAVRVVKSVKNFTDNFLWHGMQPAIKVQLAQHILQQAQADVRYAGVPTEMLMSDIATYVNDAFGGQEWTQYVWANPMSRDIMQSLIFAPDWTLSALNVAGIPEAMDEVLGTNLARQTRTQLAKNQKIEQYWPAFLLIVLFGVPAAVQASLYMAFGDPDEGDKMFPWQNEEGRRTYINVSGLWRRLGARFGFTNRQNVYIRWGKQAWEIAGWLMHPRQILMSKSSMAVKTALEQVLGKNSAWWDMPWVNAENAPLGGLFYADGKFSKSRMYALGTKFIPMSISTMLEGRPSSFFAPARLGNSKTALVDKMVPILYAYADTEVQGKIASKRKAEQNMMRMVSSLMEAATLNGYDADKDVFKVAVGKARSRVYHEIFNELNRKGGPRDEEVTEMLRKLRRLGATRRGLLTAVERQVEGGNIKFTSDIRQSLMSRWYEAQKAKREGETE